MTSTRASALSSMLTSSLVFNTMTDDDVIAPQRRVVVYGVIANLASFSRLTSFSLRYVGTTDSFFHSFSCSYQLEHRATFGVPVITHTIRHTVRLLWTSDQPVAEASTYTGQHNRQTSMPRAGFEPATSATKRPELLFIMVCV
jgi:hypothetical protein